MNTKEAIINSAFELLEIKPFKEIIIEDILQKANVSRRTFYKYFLDKHDLMHEYFKLNIGNILINQFDGSNWYELTKQCFDYFLSRSAFLSNVKDINGQNSLWEFLIGYVRNFYIDIKAHNKKGNLSPEEIMTAEGIASVSVYFYQLCIFKSNEVDSTRLTLALEALIPPSYRQYEH